MASGVGHRGQKGRPYPLVSLLHDSGLLDLDAETLGAVGRVSLANHRLRVELLGGGALPEPDLPLLRLVEGGPEEADELRQGRRTACVRTRPCAGCGGRLWPVMGAGSQVSFGALFRSFLLVVSIAYLVAVGVLVLGRIPVPTAVQASALLPMAYLIWRLDAHVRTDIRERLGRTLGCRDYDRLQVYSKTLPAYRFVDVFRAAARYCDAQGASVVIDSEHAEDLGTLLHTSPISIQHRRVQRSPRRAWTVAPGSEAFFSVDRFWVRPARSKAGPGRLLVRVRYAAYGEQVILAVASDDADLVEESLVAILDEASRGSIYRNRLLDIAFETHVTQEYGEFQSPARMLVRFRQVEPIEDEDIVLEEDVRNILLRNVVRLQTQREVLKRHGVPIKRGVLFYGAPGTGKTYACQYLCGKLPGTTTVVATGAALLQVRSIFGFAKLLQPALVILEDVDLVFQARESNPYNSVLGDLLDQMDGLGNDEDVCVILTTNSIERLERAIRERPGRISQCVLFGPPSAELRRRYLDRHLKKFAAAHVDVARLVELSEGATQAFLKEWTYRAVQVAVERDGHGAEPVHLADADFETALLEMRRFSETGGARIVGFQTQSGEGVPEGTPPDSPRNAHADQD